MRFGLFIPQGWRLDLAGIDPGAQWAAMHAVAAHADTGDRWESVWVFDHFHTVPEPTRESTHEAWTLMAALAASTTRVRLGQMCTCIGYRNPAYLAKVAATVDAISGGRVEMGIGAGWYEHEWRAYGYGFPGIGARLAALDEGVQIMRQMWEHGSATLAGTHFQADGARGYPQPLQAGGIPLWIAGGGEKKTLRIAAQHAQYTNFGGNPAEFAHKSAVLEGHCRDLGRDFGQITRSADFDVVIGATQADVDRKLAWIDGHYRAVVPARATQTVESFRSGLLVGTPGHIVQRLRELQDVGLSYALAYFVDAAHDLSSVELFENEVIPALG